jgi:hypothetical protein
MRLNKLIEILESLQNVEPEADIVLNTSLIDFEPHSTYDLVGINIDYKNSKPLVKLSFEERVSKKECTCRMTNMSINMGDKMEVV